MTEASSRRLGENLRAARLSAGLSPVQLAVASDVHLATVTKVEQGTSLPSVSTLLKLAFALGRTASDLLAGVELPAPGPPRHSAHEIE
ncbi:helix-turn-helix domain-containing protein [Leifsonia sp. McL0607]|uniref:helix-turn-helix domain-containing protein n=1 Tax=Leifsonia sp. McL0607 TaxID=3415672 RepID=UPI003CED4161